MFEKEPIWKTMANQAVKAGLIDPDDKISFLDRVLEMRRIKEELKLTQGELGIYLGKSQPQMSIYFRGEKKPPLWILAVMRGLQAGLYPVKSPLFEREKGLRRIKDETVEKLRQLGHNHDRWQMVDGDWRTVCDNRGGKYGIEDCHFTVLIKPDKTVETGFLILVNVDNIIKREFILDDWQECPYPSE